MSSEFSKNQLYSEYVLGFVITKLYTIFYYLHYFLLFTHLLFCMALSTNSNYFRKNYTLVLVALLITISSIFLSGMSEVFLLSVV